METFVSIRRTQHIKWVKSLKNTGDGLRVHQVKTNTIQTGNFVRTERKRSIK